MTAAASQLDIYTESKDLLELGGRQRASRTVQPLLSENGKQKPTEVK